MMKTNRGWFKTVFFSIITLGIYSLVWMNGLRKDVNKVAEGKKLPNIIVAILLGLVTLFIYPLVWELKLINRLYRSAARMGVERKGSFAFIIISWTLLSWTLVCPLIALSGICKTANNIGKAYNAQLEAANAPAPAAPVAEEAPAEAQPEEEAK